MKDPGISLMELTDAEFAAYVEACIARYAQEGAQATGMEPAAASEKAREQFGELLPDGRHPPGQIIRNVLDPDGEQVGVLWVAEQLGETPPRLFIYEIAIRESHRGRGLGSAVMLHLEDLARAAGAGQIMLHVFTHNEGAIRLYRRLGYTDDFAGTGGIRMVKRTD